MSLDSGASLQSLAVEPDAAGHLLLVGSEAVEASPAAVAALSSADAIFCEEDVDLAVLAPLVCGAFIEPVPIDDTRAPARRFLLDRARKLTGEGWRVVWVVSGDPEQAPRDIHEAGAVTACDLANCGRELRRPHAVATVQNGLAG